MYSSVVLVRIDGREGRWERLSVPDGVRAIEGNLECWGGDEVSYPSSWSGGGSEVARTVGKGTDRGTAGEGEGVPVMGHRVEYMLDHHLWSGSLEGPGVRSGLDVSDGDEPLG